MLELRTALAKKIPVDSLDPWGDTALHLATRVGLLDSSGKSFAPHDPPLVYRIIQNHYLYHVIIVSTEAFFIIHPVHTSI